MNLRMNLLVTWHISHMNLHVTWMRDIHMYSCVNITIASAHESTRDMVYITHESTYDMNVWYSYVFIVHSEHHTWIRAWIYTCHDRYHTWIYMWHESVRFICIYMRISLINSHMNLHVTWYVLHMNLHESCRVCCSAYCSACCSALQYAL